jgi:hypothetical protein
MRLYDPGAAVDYLFKSSAEATDTDGLYKLLLLAFNNYCAQAGGVIDLPDSLMLERSFQSHGCIDRQLPNNPTTEQRRDLTLRSVLDTAWLTCCKQRSSNTPINPQEFDWDLPETSEILDKQQNKNFLGVIQRHWCEFEPEPLEGPKILQAQAEALAGQCFGTRETPVLSQEVNDGWLIVMASSLQSLVNAGTVRRVVRTFLLYRRGADITNDLHMTLPLMVLPWFKFVWIWQELPGLLRGARESEKSLLQYLDACAPDAYDSVPELQKQTNSLSQRIECLTRFKLSAECVSASMATNEDFCVVVAIDGRFSKVAAELQRYLLGAVPLRLKEYLNADLRHRLITLERGHVRWESLDAKIELRQTLVSSRTSLFLGLIAAAQLVPVLALLLPGKAEQRSLWVWESWSTGERIGVFMVLIILFGLFWWSLSSGFPFLRRNGRRQQAQSVT